VGVLVAVLLGVGVSVLVAVGVRLAVAVGVVVGSARALQAEASRLKQRIRRARLSICRFYYALMSESKAALIF
jgi:hypothetical protein